MSSWKAQYFTLDELITTSRAGFDDAQRKGASDPATCAKLAELAATILDPIRAEAKKPVRVNSGYRCLALNNAINGSKTSQHMKGEAADICVPGLSEQGLWELWRWIAFDSGLKFGQCIFEDARPNTEGGAWIHISLGPPYRKPGGEVLTWTPAGYKKVTARPGKRA
jgi:zinc D-Ala-D-Ala carboxypeptidase